MVKTKIEIRECVMKKVMWELRYYLSMLFLNWSMRMIPDGVEKVMLCRCVWVFLDSVANKGYVDQLEDGLRRLRKVGRRL